MSGLYYYYDIGSYLIFVVPAIILSVIAQVMVSNAFNKYSRVLSRRAITGGDAARMILSDAGIRDVSLKPITGDLTDHYDPSNRIIALSQNVYHSTSIAAIGVAAHEAGHAVQHHTGYAALKLRNAIIPVTKWASTLALPLIIIGFLLNFSPIVWIGIIFFAGAVVFQIITLPVEFNASRRAIRCLESEGILAPDELEGAKKVLRAAALTYVAAMLVSLMQMLRFIVLAGGRRRS
ncbi:MAG: zinc metallopeptidase [Clostridia bacterium]|nr:zinc metallopeptidase [Clostridia bacterium]